jgi:hypothetical protein
VYCGLVGLRAPEVGDAAALAAAGEQAWRCGGGVEIGHVILPLAVG